jgi:hypothetical protein
MFGKCSVSLLEQATFSKAQLFFRLKVGLRTLKNLIYRLLIVQILNFMVFDKVWSSRLSVAPPRFAGGFPPNGGTPNL